MLNTLCACAEVLNCAMYYRLYRTVGSQRPPEATSESINFLGGMPPEPPSMACFGRNYFAPTKVVHGPQAEEKNPPVDGQPTGSPPVELSAILQVHQPILVVTVQHIRSSQAANQELTSSQSSYIHVHVDCQNHVNMTSRQRTTVELFNCVRVQVHVPSHSSTDHHTGVISVVQQDIIHY